VLDDYDQDGQGGLLVANSRFLEQHRDAVTSFTEVYLQTIRRLSDGEIKTDDQALAAMQKYTNVPPDVIRLGPDPFWPKDGHAALDSLRDQQIFAMRTGSTDYSQPLEIEKLIDYGPLDAAEEHRRLMLGCNASRVPAWRPLPRRGCGCDGRARLQKRYVEGFRSRLIDDRPLDEAV